MAWEGIESPIEAVPRMRRGERVRYVPNHRSFGAFIRSDQMREPTEEVAKDIAKMAASLAPRSNKPGPHMADQFKVVRNAGLIKVGGNLRVKVEVVNSDEAAAVNEFGGRNHKRNRMLGRAGAMFGDFKPKDGPGGGA